MRVILMLKKIGVLIFLFFIFIGPRLYADEKLDAIVDQIQIISKDIKTLEKAVYKSADVVSSSSSSNSSLNEDILTKHLLKLNELLQEQL